MDWDDGGIRHYEPPCRFQMTGIGYTLYRFAENSHSFATSHVLEGVVDPAIVQKRSLGIAVANVVLILLDLLLNQAGSSTHRVLSAGVRD